MRVALGLAAALAVPATAVAQEPAPSPPLPVPLPQVPVPAEPTPAPETAPPPEEPKVDPAYAEKPDRASEISANPLADGGPGYFSAPRGKPIVIVSHPDRSTANLTALVALGGSGAIATAIGLVFHLRSNNARDEVASDRFTGEVWTADRQAAYDRAHSSSIVAGALYGIGGALLLSTAIVYIATDPEPEYITINPHVSPKPTATVAPTRGGAMVGGTWSF
jgi:hypothetical protein